MIAFQAAGNARPSFVQNALSELTEPADPTKLEDIKKVAATMYSGTSGIRVSSDIS